MERQNFQERRKFVRANVRSLVIIRCDVLVNIPEKTSHEFHTHTENISEGGMNVILEEELRSPDAVAVRLYLTGKVKPIECKGKVAWSKLISPTGIEPGLFSTGISFIELSDNDKTAIRKVVSCLIA